MRTSKFSISGLIGVDFSSIVNEAIKTILSQFIFFLQKDFERTKTQINQNQPTKTKITEQKTTMATVFLHVQELLREWKSFVLGFGTFLTLKIFLKNKKKVRNCLDNLMYLINQIYDIDIREYLQQKTEQGGKGWFWLFKCLINESFLIFFDLKNQFNQK